MTKLHKFCFYTPLKIFLISTVVSYVFFIIFAVFANTLDATPLRNRNTFNDPSTYLLVFFIAYNLFAGINLLLINLNLYKSIRDNKYLSCLSFFFFPVLIALLLMPFAGNVFYGFGLALPMLLTTLFYYRKFKLRLELGDLMDDFYYTEL